MFKFLLHFVLLLVFAFYVLVLPHVYACAAIDIMCNRSIVGQECARKYQSKLYKSALFQQVLNI